MADRTYVSPTHRRTSDPGLSARDRLVLACLRANGGQLTLSELARLLAAHARDSDPSSIPVGVLRRYYVDLERSTVRSLDRQGLLEYCEQEGTVRAVGH